MFSDGTMCHARAGCLWRQKADAIEKEDLPPAARNGNFNHGSSLMINGDHLRTGHVVSSG